MPAVDAITVAEEFVYQTLAADAAVTALLGSGANLRVWPAFAPTDAGFPYCVHDYAGGATVPKPLGALPPAAWQLHWQVAVWGQESDRQGLRAPMAAVLGALVGSEMGGLKAVTFLSADGSAWSVNSFYYAPVPAPGEMGGEGVYQRVTHEIVLELQRLG